MQTENTARNARRSTPRRRRTLTVDRKLQWTYAGLIMLAVFSVSCLLSVFLLNVLSRQARALVLYPQAAPTWHDAAIIFVAALAYSLITAAAFGLASFIFTHRMCGPVFVIGRWLEELAQGRNPELRPLRRGDAFKQLYASFIRAAETLKATRDQQQAKVDQALALAKSAIGAEDPARREALQSVTEELESLRDTVSEAICREVQETLAEVPTSSESASDTAAAVG